jgi:hypothetical protein
MLYIYKAEFENVRQHARASFVGVSHVARTLERSKGVHALV